MDHVGNIAFRDLEHDSNAWIAASVNSARLVMLAVSIEVNGDIHMVFDKAVLDTLVLSLEDTLHRTARGDNESVLSFEDLDEHAPARIIISRQADAVRIEAGIEGDCEITIIIPRQPLEELVALLRQVGRVVR